ncbi:MAG: response regulator [Bacillota bacterium]|nr:response regulator [Bacillota bacterium]
MVINKDKPGAAPDIAELDMYFKNMPDAFFLMKMLLDSSGRAVDFQYVYVNEAVYATTNLFKEDFIGKLFSEIFGGPPPEKWLKPYYAAAFDNVSKTWQDYSEEIHEYIEITCFPCGPGYAGCFVRNITEKTLYEKTVNSSSLAYREIYFIDVVQDRYQLIFPFGDKQERGSYSQSIEEHFASGKILMDAKSEVSAFFSLENLRKTLAEQDYTEYKYRRRAPDGGEEWCLTSITVCERDDNGAPATLGMSIRSIEDIVQADQRQQEILAQALDDARRANAAKSDFLSLMSHDMRTPLNVITGMATLARIHGDDPGVVADCLGKIEVSSKHLLSLVNGILDMAKIENGVIELDETDFSLSDMMEDIVLMIQSTISGKHHVLDFTLNNVEHEYVRGDENRLIQAILNVLTNAIKYTDRHGRIQVDISELEFYGQKALYRFVVRDNGCGMSPEFLAHAFEAFTREIDMGVNKVPGSGLGLAITKNIIDEMEGSIEVNSKVGEGSEFIIEVVLGVQPDRDEGKTFPQERILVVNDHESSAASISSVLASLGCEHMAVTNGSEVMEILRREQASPHPFTAVILDYIMEDGDGITLAGEIRREYGNSLIIIMASAYDYSLVKRDAAKAGVDFCCTKPIFRSKLLRILPRFRDKTDGSGNRSGKKKQKHKRLKALLAEDNVLNAEIAKNLLAYLGLEVDTVEDGKEAVDVYRLSAPYEYDCIFMDVQMPVMNGLAAAKAIRALDRPDAEIPIFAMTANVFAEDVQRTREAGMNEHIPKPIDLSQIEHILGRYFPEHDSDSHN